MTQYRCSECGHTSLKWEGKCPRCEQWQTFEEYTPPEKGSSPEEHRGSPPEAERLSEVKGETRERKKTGVQELDQVFGGGIVHGAATLIGGEPGIGKSTLLLQLCHTLSSPDRPALYVSAEESRSQVATRAERLRIHPEQIQLLCTTRLESILETVREDPPPLVVVDSIQMISAGDLNSSAGSVRQVRECTSQLVNTLKPDGIPLFLVGHVTKEGSIAGPKTMEHMVDTVLYFDGEERRETRMLRSVKNRFGSTNAVALLKMTGEGLKQVDNPSGYFMEQHGEDVPGWISMPTRMGSRTLMLEVQALTSFAHYENPSRRSTGLDYDRMNMVLAVLKKRGGLGLGDQNVYVNVAGGFRIDEPAVDLPMALAIASSFRDQPVPDGTAAVGEIGLAGEVRDVNHIESRVREAEAIGFNEMIIPEMSKKKDMTPDTLTVHSVESLQEALEII